MSIGSNLTGFKNLLGLCNINNLIYQFLKDSTQPCQGEEIRISTNNLTMQPTLVILAAGLGTRFGGNKQIASIGPSGECIMDYSVYDAIQAGFDKVVFVINESFKDDFMADFNAARFNHLIQVAYVCQELNKIPDGFSVPSVRIKPWGTNHALMMAAEVVASPFAVINADDFYGRDSFVKISNYLQSVAGKEHQYCMIGYDIVNTLVESGGTSRAECIMDKNNSLIFVEERTDVQSTNGKITGYNVKHEVVEMSKNTIVSMNCWGFTPDYFKYCKQYFEQFLSDSISSPAAEFLIPAVVNDLIVKQTVTVKVFHSDAEWFGLTYMNDKSLVIGKLTKLIQSGVYPLKLWS
ncbi:MAG: NTP transferase domain-containing protein [Bacteroidota bacterium]